MPNYIVRFQLQHGTNQHYLALKRLLIHAKFSKVIKGSDGLRYLLPQGTYLAITEHSSNDVLKLSIMVAKRIRLRYQIFVTEAAAYAWANLDLASPHEK